MFWINASTEEEAKRGFATIASKCELPDTSLDSVLYWLGNTDHSWLLILDNCDDSTIDYSQYLPPTQRGSVIITTRLTDYAKYYKTFNTDDMGLDDATELLLKSCGVLEKDWQSERSSAKKVTELLGQHALAIFHAGAYIRNGRCTLAEYPTIFDSRRVDLMKFRPRQMASTYKDVYTTFEVSAQALELQANDSGKPDEEAGLALQLLNLLAFMHREDVEESVMTNAWEEHQKVIRQLASDTTVCSLSEWHCLKATSSKMIGERPIVSFRTARARLGQLSLITLAETSQSISLHPVVHDWARLRMELQIQIES